MTRYPQLRNPNFYLMLLLDVFLFIVSLYVSCLLRFDFDHSLFIIKQTIFLLPWIVPLKLIVFLANGLYRGLWRYTGLKDFWLLGRACLMSTALIFMIMLVATIL